MMRLTAYIEALMTDPDRRPFVSPATLLSALSGVYGGAMVLRAGLYRRGLLERRRLPCRVVSVGNLTVGGTGKTPLVMDLAARLRDRGWPVCVLSRGYRGTAERTGAVVSDGYRILVPAKVAGDEPWLMARRLAGIPVIVGRDRWASGMTAVDRFGARAVVLDDGFQHQRLVRDLDVLLLDARKPMGNGHLLPRGPLREPITAARRAHALVRIHRRTGAGSETVRCPRSPEILARKQRIGCVLQACRVVRPTSCAGLPKSALSSTCTSKYTPKSTGFHSRSGVESSNLDLFPGEINWGLSGIPSMTFTVR